MTLNVSQHQPVLVDQVLEQFGRSQSPCLPFTGTLVDGTVGGAGHAQHLLEQLSPQGRLVCFDRDPQALERAQGRLGGDDRVTFVQDSYAELGRYLEPESACGFLLDLGLSTDQLAGSRGFAFQQDSPLDMRFDPTSETTAFEIVNWYSVAKLREIFFRFGEEPLAPRIARQIDKTRAGGAIRTTAELAAVIKAAVPERFRLKALARVFQALRIEVNREIEHLEAGLIAGWKALRVGGVFCVLSYHSIEDRRVKRFFAQQAKGCVCPPRLPICACGQKPSAQILTRGALRPSPSEIRKNPAARSAHLRAALKIPQA